MIFLTIGSSIQFWFPFSIFSGTVRQMLDLRRNIADSTVSGQPSANTNNTGTCKLFIATFSAVPWYLVTVLRAHNLPYSPFHLTPTRPTMLAKYVSYSKTL